MSGPQFFETRMGRQFYESTVPDLVRALERIAGNMTPVPVSAGSGRINVGTPVLIRSNPHHPASVNVPGTAIGYRDGAGFGGVDLIVVEYRDTLEGTIRIRPFAPNLLTPMDSDALIRMAENHEALAAELRRQAAAEDGGGSGEEDRD